MHIEDDDELEIELVDEHAEDCADYFATILTEAFPEIDLIAYQPNEWRKGWRIIVPAQFTESVADLADKAKAVRDELWWRHSILVPFLIERPQD